MTYSNFVFVVQLLFRKSNESSPADGFASLRSRSYFKLTYNWRITKIQTSSVIKLSYWVEYNSLLTTSSGNSYVAIIH